MCHGASSEQEVKSEQEAGLITNLSTHPQGLTLLIQVYFSKVPETPQSDGH